MGQGSRNYDSIHEGAIVFSLLQSIKTVSGAHTASCMVGTEDISCGKSCTVVNLPNPPSSAEIMESLELCPYPPASLYGSHIKNFTFCLDEKDSVVSLRTWRFRDRIQVEVRLLAPVQAVLGTHFASSIMVIGNLPQV
jgi:hypothetical protein